MSHQNGKGFWVIVAGVATAVSITASVLSTGSWKGTMETTLVAQAATIESQELKQKAVTNRVNQLEVGQGAVNQHLEDIDSQLDRLRSAQERGFDRISDKLDAMTRAQPDYRPQRFPE